ncbi:hypothetical protein PoB_004071800 [Plakobranchus ocellatus]|uniref:Uncharacterized protein n=1 Tax=Plakobranchus ocellatus TaxID=259542 RepID=A0AAV4B3R1_9GAST|nr:hypothetical protein PoB_004071800 [Plakobranchus ocellatus]
MKGKNGWRNRLQILLSPEEVGGILVSRSSPRSAGSFLSQVRDRAPHRCSNPEERRKAGITLLWSGYRLKNIAEAYGSRFYNRHCKQNRARTNFGKRDVRQRSWRATMCRIM